MWLKPYLRTPRDAAAPLAMSPVHPEASGSHGPKAIRWIERELGIKLRWWQRLAVVRQLECRADGSLCWTDVVESASRRVGKSVRLRSMALWRLAIGPSLFSEPQLAIHTGKDLAIVREIQRGAWRWAEARDWRVVRAIGRESIEDGDHRWVARSTDSVYGYDITLGMVDEGWDVDPLTVSEGMEPAAMERNSPQIVLTSTAHRKATSLMRGRISDALAVDSSSLLLLWGVPDDADTGDLATWRAASAYWSLARLQLMQSKYEKALRGEADLEFDDPDPMAGFESQYLNRWQLRQGVSTALPGWAACVVEDEPPAVTAIGLAVSLDLEWGSIGAAGPWPDGRINVGAVERRHGTRWLVAEAKRIQDERGCVVVVDEKCPDASLIPALHDANVRVMVAKLNDYIEACSEFVNAVKDELLTHQHTTELDDAIAAAVWRMVGDRKVWGRKQSTADISMLEAVTLAKAKAGAVYDLMESFW